MKPLVQHRVEQLVDDRAVQLLQIRLQPRAAGLEEALRFIGVVVILRQILNRPVAVRRFGIAVVVLDRRAFFRDVDRVHRVDAVLRDVHRDAHAELARFFRDRVVDVGPQPRLAGDLHAVDAERVPFIDDLARAFRRRVARIVAAPERIDVHPRRDDLIRGALLPLGHHRLRIRVPDVEHAHRRHAVPEQQLVDVVGRHIGVRADVRVAVHEARHQVHARAVDDAVGLRRRAAAAAGADRIDPIDTINQVVLDDDVHRPVRGRAGSIDHGDVSDQQCGVGPRLLDRRRALRGRDRRTVGQGGQRQRRGAGDAERPTKKVTGHEGSSAEILR